MKFADIKNDIAFRKIFGNDKKTEILISFLNAVMHLEGDNRIKAITIANPFQLPILHNMKTSIIDARSAEDFLLTPMAQGLPKSNPQTFKSKNGGAGFGVFTELTY